VYMNELLRTERLKGKMRIMGGGRGKVLQFVLI
jgi:hypothetical protein